jgi:hypothetical protein
MHMALTGLGVAACVGCGAMCLWMLGRMISRLRSAGPRPRGADAPALAKRDTRRPRATANPSAARDHVG